MSVLSISVPSKCVERFRNEVLTDLRTSAENVMEAVDWMGEGKGDPDRIDDDLNRYAISERLFIQVRHAGPNDLTVSGPRQTLAGLLRMAIIGCIEDAQKAVDHGATAGALRDVLSAFRGLLDVIDQCSPATATGAG